MRSVAATLGLALGLALLSSVIEGTRLEVQDWDCPPAPASCARPVIVKGFPVPYISDHHGISPVGSADLVGAMLGMDHFHAGRFAIEVALCWAVVVALLTAYRRLSPTS
jgi:hypothetical protein